MPRPIHALLPFAALLPALLSGSLPAAPQAPATDGPRLRWLGDLEGARALAARESKLLLVVFR